MTTEGISNQGEGCSTGVSVPQRGGVERWLSTRMWPVACVTVRLDIHTQQGVPLQCVSIEVSNPHTKELEAHVVRPAENYESPEDMVSRALMELRGLLLELFDPDPF